MFLLYICIHKVTRLWLISSQLQDFSSSIYTTLAYKHRQISYKALRISTFATIHIVNSLSYLLYMHYLFHNSHRQKQFLRTSITITYSLFQLKKCYARPWTSWTWMHPSVHLCNETHINALWILSSSLRLCRCCVCVVW